MTENDRNAVHLTLDEEEAKQGIELQRMRWVLAISLGLAIAALCAWTLLF